MNSSSAAKQNHHSGDALEGLENFYDVEILAAKEVTGSSKGTAHSPENVSGIAQWLTVEEAARRLEISQNAVIKRLGKGKLHGRKVPGQFGEKWMVDPSGLPEEVHVQFTEEQPGAAPETPGNSKGTASEGKEQPLQSEQSTPQSFDILAEVIRQQTEQIKLQNDMIKYLSSQVQEKDGHIKLLTHKRSGWPRFWSWFTGKHS